MPHLDIASLIHRRGMTEQLTKRVICVSQMNLIDLQQMTLISNVIVFFMPTCTKWICVPRLKTRVIHVAVIITGSCLYCTLFKQTALGQFQISRHHLLNVAA